MKLLKILTLVSGIALSTLTALGAAIAGETVGVRQMSAPSAERGSDLDVTVWYPSSSGGVAVTLGESVFFAGTSAMRDAPISPGNFPLVMLSHASVWQDMRRRSAGLRCLWQKRGSSSRPPPILEIRGLTDRRRKR